MREFLSKLASGIFNGVGRKAAEFAMGQAFAAYNRAESITLTAEEEAAAKANKEGDDDAKAVKQTLRDKKRKAAVADIKQGLGFIDAVVPDVLINFLVEVVALANNLGLADQLQSILK